MTVYRSRPEEPHAAQATSGQIPAVRRRRRALRWLLAVLVLVLLGNVLLVEAYTNARFGPDGLAGSGQPGATVPGAVRDGGPVIDFPNGEPRSRSVRDRTIALTFDDGPDPTWTPRILVILRKYGVHATFFVVGSQVSRHPDLVRRIVAEGHELGVHTFTHPRLADLSTWRRSLEQSQTRAAVAYAARTTTPLFRPPYSSMPNALDDGDWTTVREFGAQGYVAVLNDLDSRDWARPGVDAIVRNATPENGAGAIVLMHDSGGDRAETLAALDRLIPLLRDRGYRFATVSAGLGEQPADRVAETSDVWRGGALVWTIRVADATLWLLWIMVILVGALTLARTLILFFVALHHAHRRRASTWSWGEPVTEPVSILVPAFNEVTPIGPAVRSLAASEHDVEVVVVDDASTDGTAEAVEALGLDNVRVARIPSGGKATALNTGIALARHDLIVMVDADTVVPADAIHTLVQPLGDPEVGAVAGNVKVGNRRGLLGRWQHIEYVIGFNLDRRLYDTLGCIPTIPGALGAFRRQALRDAGALSVDTLAEDTDLTMALHREGWRVVYEENAHAYTEAPVTLRELWRQRYRWSYGTMQAIWKHRRSVVERGPSGRFGRRGLPLITLFTVLLPLLAPLLDVLAVYGVFFLNRWEALAGWLAVLLVQTVTAVLAFRLDREPLRPLWTLPLQQFAYRQVMYLVLLRSAFTALTGRTLRWQKLRRTGEVVAV